MLQGKWLLKHRFVHEKEKKNMKLGNTTHKNKKQLAIEFLQIKKALDFVHL